MIRRFMSAALAVASLAAGVALAAPASATTPPLVVTGTTVLTNRPDNGSHGHWALDHLTRTLTVTRGEAVDASHCGGASATCYSYKATFDDKGTFVTIDAHSPNAGVTTHAGLKGAMSGAMSWTFYSTSTPQAKLIPASKNGSSPGSSKWYGLAFTGGTKFYDEHATDWGWTYDAPDCSKAPAGTQHMTDSQTNASTTGHEFVGDILTPACVPQPTPTVTETTPGPTVTTPGPTSTVVVTAPARVITVSAPVTANPSFTG